MLKRFSSEAIGPEQLDVARRMAFMSEHYDKDTAMHRERVRSYSMLLARGLGLATDEANLIACASLLHDVGKVIIPVEIASKAGILTPYEWDVTKRHTTFGAEILRASTSILFQVGEVITLTHHERWDGSGYPQGLKDESIPMSGRICALADVFDALTSRRHYKNEISIDDALDLIKESSGILFDPQLVEIMQDHYEDLFRIRTFGTSRLRIDN
jgi:putative two-component system response regulator